MLMMSRQPRPDQGLLTAEEVAWLCGVESGKTIRRWVAAGKFCKPVPLPGTARWSRADVDLWLECSGQMILFERLRRERRKFTR